MTADNAVYQKPAATRWVVHAPLANICLSQLDHNYSPTQTSGRQGVVTIAPSSTRVLLMRWRMSFLLPTISFHILDTTRGIYRCAR